MQLNDLERRIIDISYKNKLSHIGSCLTSVNLIDYVYTTKGEKDLFILSNGHAGLALYVVLEKIYGMDAEKLYEENGVHPNTGKYIAASSGSLGHGIGIALGMAIADPSRLVYCMVSDGECAEGSVWESIRIAAELKIDNLIIIVNANGFGAYKEVELDRMEWMLASFVHEKYPKVSFVRTDMEKYPEYLKGLEAHYHILTKEEYEQIIGE